MPPLYSPLFPAAGRAATLPYQDALAPAPPAYAPPTPPLPTLPGMPEPGGGARPRRRKRSTSIKFTPEEQTSLLREIMGGVQWVGETVDKLGAASRGTISGIVDMAQGRTPDWGGGLLNAIPFSDTLGITDPTKRVDEWELGEKLGMPANQPGIDRWDFAKFGLGVVTDPTFWATGPLGSLTKQGAAKMVAAKAAQKASLAKGAPKAIGEAIENVKPFADEFTNALDGGIGKAALGGEVTPAAAVEAIRAGDRALLGIRRPTIRPTTFGLPVPHIGMTDEAVATFGTGEWAANVAHKLFYGGGGRLSMALSPMRTAIIGWRGAFTPHVRGQFSALAQRTRDIGHAEAQLLGDAANDLVPRVMQLDGLVRDEYMKAAQSHLKAGGPTAQQSYEDFMRMAAERMEFEQGVTPSLDALQNIARTTLGNPNLTLPELVNNNNQLSDGILKLLDTMQLKTEIPAYRDLMDLGADTKMLDDIYTYHFGRRPSNVGILKEPGKNVNKAFFQFAIARQGPLRDLPGGTWFVNKLARDDVYRGWAKTTANQTDLSKVSAAKKLQIGQTVHAMDRDNYGWVWDVHKNGKKVLVHFESPQGGVADKWLDESLLTGTRGTPKPPPEKFFRKMTPAEHEGRLRDALRQAGVTAPKDAELADLRKLYLRTQHVEPALNDAWQGVSTRSWQTGDPIDRAEEYSRWFDDTIQARDKDGALQWNKDGTPKMVPHTPRLDEIDKYFSNLPASTTLTGLFDRSVLTDWQDYMQSIIAAQSTMRSAHALMAAPGALREATPNAVGETPLDEAWRAVGFTDQGLAKIAAKMAPQGTDPATWASKQVLSPQAYKTLKAFGESTKPEAMVAQTAFGKNWDKMMAYYKGHLTLPFLAFHGRNSLSNVFLAWTEGNVGISPLLKATKEFMWDYAIKGKVSDEVAQLIEEGIQIGAITAHKGVLTDIAGSAVHENLRPGFANFKRMAGKLTPKGRAQSMAERGWTPQMLEDRGKGLNALDFVLGTRRKVPEELAEQGVQAMPVSPLIDVGESLFEVIEGAGRGGYYIALRREGFSPSQAKHMVDRALYDYGKLSKTDKAIKRLVPFWCVPTDCEILTKQGWKTHDQLRIGDMVLGYDIATDEQCWTPVEAVSVFDYDGVLLSLTKRQPHAKWLFTPDHRWPVKDHTGERKIVRGYELRPNHRIPRTAPMRDWGDPGMSLTPREAAIVGWLLAEGHMRPGEWVIYQHPKKHLDEILALLQNGAGKQHTHPTTGVVQVRLTAQMRQQLKYKGFHAPEDAEKIVGGLTRQAAESMWDAMMKGDGHSHPADENGQGAFESFACCKPHVFNTAQMLVQLLGQSLNASAKGGYVSATRRWFKIHGDIDNEWYRGQVWCPKTGTGTWVMRRNGAIIITGNTWRKKNIPAQLRKLVDKPAQQVATLRAVNTVGQQEQHTPAWIREQLGIPMPEWLGGTPPEGAQNYLTQFGLPIEDLDIFALEGGKPSKRTAQKLAAGLAPPVTAILASFTGEDPFTGKPLKELKPIPGTLDAFSSVLPDATARTLADKLAFAVSHLPIARYETELAKAIDWNALPGGRKSAKAVIANLLTGIKSQTVENVEDWKYRDLQNVLRRRVEASPYSRSYEIPYLPEEFRAKGFAEEEQVDLNRISKLSQVLKQIRERREREKAVAASQKK